MDEKRTLEERYLQAAGSSHLRMDLEKPGDIDLMVAAGMCRESLATSLHRLRGEFDRAAGPIRLANARQRELSRLADEQRQLARGKAKASQALAAEHADQAARITKQAEDEALTSRALALVAMKSLDGVTRVLRHYGEQQAARRGFDASPEAVRRLVGRVLDLVLDPLCPVCCGVGFSGGYGKAKTLCSTCKGSKRRRVDFGSVEAQAFGNWMLADIERKLARTEQLMMKFLARAADGEVVLVTRNSAQSAELKRRLAELRSAQSAKD